MAFAPPADPGSTSYFTFDRTAVAIGIALAALSVVLGVLALRRRKRQPCYAVLANNLLRDHTARLPALDIRFSGIPVQSLTIARVAIWNAGREPIRTADVGTTDPLALVTSESVRILDAQVIQSTSPPSAMSLTPASRNEIRMTFEFLNHRHGCVIEVVHTGTGADDLTVRGTIQDSGPIRRVSVSGQAKNMLLPRSSLRELAMGVFVAAASLTGFFVLMALVAKQPIPVAVVPRTFGALVLTFGALAGFLVLVRDLRASRPMPRGFEKIAEGLFDQ